MKIFCWAFSFALLLFLHMSMAAEVGDHGMTKLACLTQGSAEELIKADNKEDKMEDLQKRQLCALGPPVGVTLKKEYKIQGQAYSVWEIEEQEGLYIVAPRSAGTDVSE